MNMQLIHSNGTCEIFFTGTFTFTDNATFKQVLELVDSPQVRSFILDFSGVDFIDSAVLGMMMILRSTAAVRGQNITIRGAQNQVEKVMRMSQFDTKFAMV